MMLELILKGGYAILFSTDQKNLPSALVRFEAILPGGEIVNVIATPEKGKIGEGKSRLNLTTSSFTGAHGAHFR